MYRYELVNKFLGGFTDKQIENFRIKLHRNKGNIEFYCSGSGYHRRLLQIDEKGFFVKFQKGKTYLKLETSGFNYIKAVFDYMEIIQKKGGSIK